MSRIFFSRDFFSFPLKPPRHYVPEGSQWVHVDLHACACQHNETESSRAGRPVAIGRAMGRAIGHRHTGWEPYCMADPNIPCKITCLSQAATKLCRYAEHRTESASKRVFESSWSTAYQDFPVVFVLFEDDHVISLQHSWRNIRYANFVDHCNTFFG